MRSLFFNSRGFRAGWRLLIFVGIFVALGFLANWIIPKILHLKERPFLDPVGTISDELQGLIQVLVATWIMARIRRRRFPHYGIPLRLHRSARVVRVPHTAPHRLAGLRHRLPRRL